MHGGGPKVVPGKPLDSTYTEENIPLLKAGCANLAKHVANAVGFGVNVVVAVNRFTADTDKEIETVREAAVAAGAMGAYESNVWAKGGEGGAELAQAVVDACEKPTNFQYLYPDDMTIKQKIETIATKIYGAAAVDYAPEAEKKIAAYTKMGLDELPLCMAKTHLSLSHDPTLKGAPSGWTLPIRDVRAAAGAGFLYPLCGEMRTMPGLPTIPAFMAVDITEDGKVKGLF